VEEITQKMTPLSGSVSGSPFTQEPQRLETEADSLRASGPDGPARAFDLYSRAAQIYSGNNQYEQALAAVDKALGIRRQADALATKGEILRLLGGEARLRTAADALDEAIRLQPDYGWAHAVYGETLRMLGRLDEAAEELKRAVAADSTVGEWHYRLADLLMLLDRCSEAIDTLNEALRINPDDAAALSRRGEALRRTGRIPEALADLDRALKLAPDDAWTLARKGEALRGAGKPSEAMQALRRALDLMPEGNPFVEVSMGYALLALNREAEALRLFDQAIEHDPSLSGALEGKARAFMQLEEIKKSFAVCRQALEADPEARYAHAISGVLWFLVEEYARAVEALERSTRLDSELGWSQLSLAYSYVYLAKSSAPPEAEEFLDKAIAAATAATRMLPDDSSSAVGLAEALFKRSRTDAAGAEFKRALELATAQEQNYYACADAGWATYRLAILNPAHAASYLAQAERSLVEALTLKTDRPTSSNAVVVKFNIALVMLCSGRFALALREFDSTSKLAAEMRDAGLHRGVLGRVKMDLAEAIELWPSLHDSTRARKVLEDLETRYSAACRAAEADYASARDVTGAQTPVR
jgi:tetratricopeptide (TPR) repeat protein